MTQKQMTQNQMTQKQMTQRQMTQNQLTQGQMTQKQMTQGCLFFKSIDGAATALLIQTSHIPINPPLLN